MLRLFGCCRTIQTDPKPDVPRQQEHLSPEASDLYLKFAKTLAAIFKAEYVSILFRDIECGLGGITSINTEKRPHQRSAVHNYFMNLMLEQPGSIEFLLDNNKPETSLSALSNRVVFPLISPESFSPRGLIGLCSCARLAFCNDDLLLISHIGDFLRSEIDAMKGDDTGNTVVLFDAGEPGWPAMLTSSSWRRLTGISDGQCLKKSFNFTDALPISGCIRHQNTNGNMNWSFVIDMQPVKLTKDKQIWTGTILSVTDISSQPSSELSLIDDLESTPNLPRTLKEINLGALLGKGGFGNVYRGVWQGIQVAVKVLEETPLSQTDQLQEAKIGERLEHKNLVKTIASGNDTVKNGNRCTWIMMELCEKGTLWQAVEGGYFRLANTNGSNHDDEKVQIQKMLEAALQVADGMQYLHENDILHGDLNCNNILMTRDMVPKISDLGLSRVFAGNTLGTDTYGTISHQPPELLATGQLSLSSDVYSFGVILFEICTGRRAYSGLRPAQIITQKLADATLQLPDSSPVELCDFVERCMANDHRARPTFFEAFSWLKEYSTRFF